MLAAACKPSDKVAQLHALLGKLFTDSLDMAPQSLTLMTFVKDNGFTDKRMRGNPEPVATIGLHIVSKLQQGAFTQHI